MEGYGFAIKQGQDMTRLHLRCTHQHGLVYFVPAEKSWVCSPERIPAHALAGFFGELMGLKDANVKDIMQRWGLYFRQLPLDEEEHPQGPIE